VIVATSVAVYEFSKFHQIISDQTTPTLHPAQVNSSSIMHSVVATTSEVDLISAKIRVFLNPIKRGFPMTITSFF